MGRVDDILAQAGLELARDRDGFALTDGSMAVRADFSRMIGRIRPANLNRELLVKAAKLKGARAGRPTAVDATAGLGEDALLLAAAGFEVTLFERNPVIALMLRDAIWRARLVPELAEAARRMSLEEGDSAVRLPGIGFSPDIVFLDPMFPDKRKDAAVKKKLQLLQRLEEPCGNEAALLEAAIAVGPRKIIVKRPVKGPQLAGHAPSYSLAGKAVRYDVIVP